MESALYTEQLTTNTGCGSVSKDRPPIRVRAMRLPLDKTDPEGSGWASAHMICGGGCGEGLRAQPAPLHNNKTLQSTGQQGYSCMRRCRANLEA